MGKPPCGRHTRSQAEGKEAGSPERNTCNPLALQYPARILRQAHKRWVILHELRDVTFSVNGLSVFIGLALFQLHGFFAEDTLWTPLRFGYRWNAGDGHFVPPGRGSLYVSL